MVNLLSLLLKDHQTWEWNAHAKYYVHMQRKYKKKNPTSRIIEIIWSTYNYAALNGAFLPNWYW